MGFLEWRFWSLMLLAVRKYCHVLSRKMLLVVDKEKKNPLTFQATILIFPWKHQRLKRRHGSKGTGVRLLISVHHAPHLSHQVIKSQSVKPRSINGHLQHHGFICFFCLVIGGSTYSEEHESHSVGSTSSEEHESHSVPSYILPRRTNLTDVQKKQLKEKIGAICSEIPIYVCVMKKTNVSGEHQSMVSEDFVPQLIFHCKCTSSS